MVKDTKDTRYSHNTYRKFTIDSRLRYFKPHSVKVEKTFAEEVTDGLNRKTKFVNPKFFYDKIGSELFEQICTTPEYYPTRTEIAILTQIKDDLLLHLGNGHAVNAESEIRLVELGSGSSVKTRTLLEVLSRYQEHTEYMPIDISEILAESSEQLLAYYKNLSITGIIDTYEGGLQFLKRYDKKKSLIAFLGSSFGNLTPKKGAQFLKMIYDTMKTKDLFMIGLDLVKDKDVLESAYSDSAGVTAQFNKNVLSRINNELDADFNLANFDHYIKYNKKDQRIEMYLQSLYDQSVIIAKAQIKMHLKKGEMIHTEYSHKYTTQQIQTILTKAGFTVRHIWSDDSQYFALALASKD